MSHISIPQHRHITEAEHIAFEHVGYRRSCGWTWGMVLSELYEVAAACDVRLPGTIDSPALVIQAYAAVAAVLSEEARPS